MTTLELFLASLGLGLITVFWCWFICYEVEQRRKEAEARRAAIAAIMDRR